MTRLNQITRASALRYFFPFSAEGRFAPLLLLRHARLYLRRNAAASLLFYLLQQPLTGLSLTSVTWQLTPWQALYLLLPMPFLTMAVIALLVIVESNA